MVADYRRRYDDDDSGTFAIRRRSTGNNTLLFVMLAVAGVGLVLIAGVVIVVAVVVMQNSTAEKLPGSWKGRFDLGAGPTDHVYTFNKDGTFREETFDLQGRRLRVSDGHWSFFVEEIEIDWNNGNFENATVDWQDDDTIRYQIVDHSDQAQVGLAATFRRQK